MRESRVTKPDVPADVFALKPGIAPPGIRGLMPTVGQIHICESHFAIDGFGALTVSRPGFSHDAPS